MKFGKDRSTNCEDMNFQKSKLYMKTFGNYGLEATLASNKGFHTKFWFLKIHIFIICGAIFSKLHIFTNFNELFPAMIIIFLSCKFWNYVINPHCIWIPVGDKQHPNSLWYLNKYHLYILRAIIIIYSNAIWTIK